MTQVLGVQVLSGIMRHYPIVVDIIRCVGPRFVRSYLVLVWFDIVRYCPILRCPCALCIHTMSTYIYGFIACALPLSNVQPSWSRWTGIDAIIMVSHLQCYNLISGIPHCSLGSSTHLSLQSLASRQPLSSIMVAWNKATSKKTRIITPADESLGHLGNANMQAARRKLNELLDAQPQHVWQMLEMMQNGTISKICDAKLRDQTKTHWHGTQVRMQVIPKYWMEAYMLDINPEIEKLLDAIKSSSKTAIRELFYASHMVSGSTLIPPAAHEKVVFAKVLRERHVQCGSRVAKAHLWPKLPGFRWTHLPIFVPEVKGNLLICIKHISGACCKIP